MKHSPREANKPSPQKKLRIHHDKTKNVVKNYFDTQNVLSPRKASPQAFKLNKPQALPSCTVGEVLWRREASLATPRRVIEQEKLSAILWYSLQEMRETRALCVQEDPLNAVKSYGSAFDVISAFMKWKDSSSYILNV